VTGSGEVQSVYISADVVDPDDVEMLEDLVVAAVGDGLRRAQELQTERMGSVTGGLDLGGLGGMLG
jgi:nucleoid-associated protein EbfC